MKINVGAGSHPLEGYINIDRATGGEAFPLSQDGVVFDTGVADEIRASHVLEHFSHRQTLDVLKEWVRVLKPGGLLKIAVPDFNYASSQMGKHELAPFWIMGGHCDNNDVHGAIFTETILRKALKECGIEVSSCRWKSEGDCAALPVSLNLYGVKSPVAVNVDKPVLLKRRKILGLMSTPRTGFQHTNGCIQSIFQAYGIPVQMYFGAFWEQGIQGGMISAIEQGFDDVITLDYDSVFDETQFRRMWGQWHNDLDTDALSCFQPQRGSGLTMLTPMGHEHGESEVMVTHSDRGLPVRTAHFGLTFIRLDKLKNMAKPWFWGQPNKDGDWKKEGCIDADIYFWRKWEAAGNNLRVLTDVLLGHLEVLIGQTNPKTGRAIYRFTGDWNIDPYKGLMADVKEKESAKPVNPAHQYDAMSVYHPELDVYPAEDTYPVSFQQRGNTVLGEPSTDLSGSQFENVGNRCLLEREPRNGQRRILITFSGARYHATTKCIVDNAPQLGVDATYVYDDAWLIEKHPEFIDARNDLFYDKIAEKEVLLNAVREMNESGCNVIGELPRKYTRGFGWFCWKPFIILDALERFCDDGDIVMFTDGDCYPIASLKPFFDYTDEHGVMLFAAAGFKQGNWCKRDCDEVMGMSFREKKAGNARYMAFKKGAESWQNDRRFTSKSFLESWLKFASNKKATTFEKSENEYPDLQQHRCEQAILTNLAHWYGIPLHRPPCEDGAIFVKGK